MMRTDAQAHTKIPCTIISEGKKSLLCACKTFLGALYVVTLRKSMNKPRGNKYLQMTVLQYTKYKYENNAHMNHLC